jgi:hypothetical protein
MPTDDGHCTQPDAIGAEGHADAPMTTFQSKPAKGLNQCPGSDVAPAAAADIQRNSRYESKKIQEEM